MSQESHEILSQVEELAAQAVRRVGRLLMDRFGSALTVEFKDRHRRDPVTEVDHQAQALLREAIADRFPDHGILGEEDSEEEAQGDGGPLPEYLWVLDPLDGTRNFLAGLPLFACSVGVLHRGRPAAGALFVPWPGSAGAVLHARRGGGAYRDGRPLRLEAGELRPEALTGIPGSFPQLFRPRRRLRGRLGEPRMTGSVGFEMAMVACGVLQYMVTGRPRAWDVAGGAVIVAEAGGAVLTAEPAFPGRWRWRPLVGFVAPGDGAMGRLRRWAAPLLAGPPSVTEQVAQGLGRRRRLPLPRLPL